MRRIDGTAVPEGAAVFLRYWVEYGAQAAC